MPLNDSGFFGSENFRENNPNTRRNNQIKKTPSRKSKIGILSQLSPERLVDIICLSFIGVFLIIAACTWSSFSELMFTHFLFPIIYVGAKIVSVVAAIGTGIGLLCARFRRRRYR